MCNGFIRVPLVIAPLGWNDPPGYEVDDEQHQPLGAQQGWNGGNLSAFFPLSLHRWFASGKDSCTWHTWLTKLDIFFHALQRWATFMYFHHTDSDFVQEWNCLPQFPNSRWCHGRRNSVSGKPEVHQTRWNSLWSWLLIGGYDSGLQELCLATASSHG